MRRGHVADGPRSSTLSRGASYDPGVRIFGGRRSLTRAAALSLPVGLLTVVGAGAQAPASGAIVCRETFYGPGADIAPRAADQAPLAAVVGVDVPSARTSATVRVTLNIAHPDVSKLQVFVTPPDMTGFFDPNTKLFQATTGPLNGNYTFDDNATTSIDGANKVAGPYKPFNSLSQIVGGPTQGRWLVWVNNYGGPGGKLGQVSLTMTYADCPDVNGDGLHDDADGDGVLLPPDNCPDVVNPDQTDSDGDNLGNACDATPFLPPPPPVGQPGPRDVTLTYAKKLHRFKGVVDSKVASCKQGVEVELWKRRKGADRRLSVVKTSSRGRFRTQKARKRGRYYVSLPAAFVDLGAVECEAVTSRATKVRR